jgi:hypothetical protein
VAPDTARAQREVLRCPSTQRGGAHFRVVQYIVVAQFQVIEAATAARRAACVPAASCVFWRSHEMPPCVRW